MKKNLLFFVFFFQTVSGLAQNIVLNPGFEAMDSVKINHEDKDTLYKFFRVDRYKKYWYYFKDWDDYRTASKQIYGAVTGKCHAQVYLGDKKRLYLQGTLKSPLQKDQVYKLTFNIGYLASSDLRKEKLGIYFSEEKLNLQYPSSILLLHPDIEVGPLDSMISVEYNARHFFTYTKVKVVFRAKGGETFFTLGNFRKDLQKVNNRDLWVVVDDFDIEAKPDEQPLVVLNKKFQNPKLNDFNTHDQDSITFRFILFDFNESTIRQDAIPELLKLNAFLKSRKNLNLSIKAYTDSVGSSSFNQELSDERAKSVFNFFKQQGIIEKRLKAEGMGETHPFAENDTEEGRQLNRRVEFILYRKAKL